MPFQETIPAGESWGWVRAGSRYAIEIPAGRVSTRREVTATAYFCFPKYSLLVGSGPDVWVVAEERGALPSSRLLLWQKRG